jgi:hypothetical protein
MKFIIKKGTETFDKLTALFNRADEYGKQIGRFVKEIGFDEYSRDSRFLAGLSAVSAKTKPENFKEVGWRLYAPKKLKVNADLLTRWNAQPSIKKDEMNEILGFQWQFVGLRVLLSPGVVRRSDYFLVSFDDEVEYTPLPDMEELKVSEYQKLLAEVEKDANQKTGEKTV